MPPSPLPSELHDRGLAALFRGDLSRSVSYLREAVAARPDDAAGWNDLGVALLQEADSENRPVELLRADVAFRRALTADPDLPQARFNRALVLGRLSLRRRAVAAWSVFLGTDPASTWSREAESHLRELRKPSLAERWAAVQPRLQAAVERGDHAAVERLVREMPHRARVAAEEEGLGRWGAAWKAGDRPKADRQLTRTAALADALAATTGDTMARAAVARIRRALREEPPGQVTRLAAGHADFGRGLRLYRDQHGDEAAPLLRESARLLHAEGSPFAAWADFYAASCAHYADVESYLEVFRDQEVGADAARHPVLAGFAAWMVGTVENYLDHPEVALEAFARARRDLGAAGAPPETYGFVHVLVAETYDILGEPEAAWRERLQGLAAAAAGGDPRRLHATLYEAGVVASRIDPRAALPFVSELLDRDKSWGNAGALVETFTLAGRTYAALGRRQEALDAFDSAQRQAADLGRGEQSTHIAMEAAVWEGEALVGSDPRRSVARLTEALDSARREGYRGLDDRILLARARALRELGDPESAREDLAQVIEIYEGVRSSLQDRQHRLSYFEGAQDAFDAMIDLEASRGAAAAAFSFAERAHARLLLDLVQKDAVSSGLPGPLGADEVAGRIGSGVVLLELAVLPRRLVAWTFHGGKIAMATAPWSEGELSRQVGALRSALARHDAEAEIRRAASTLFDEVLRPFLASFPDGTPLVVVPDRLLAEIPFAALFDRVRGRYLIQERPVAVAPSATLYLTARDKVRGFRGQRSILAVGDPAFDRSLHPDLPRLPGSAEEATEVADLYPASEVLRFGDATPEAVEDGARVHRVVHISGHSLLDPASPWNDRMVLAPGALGSALTSRQVAALRLPETEVVVLSACHTLPGSSARESFPGLTAGFFAAGAPVVVSSLWQVDDRPTRALMVAFHRALARGVGAARALRGAQLRLLASGDPTLASPAAWGSFETYGGAFPN